VGVMLYDGATIEFDDRTLAHLHVVIINRLRRSEGLSMSWVDSVASGGGRSSIWLSPHVPVYFKFDGGRAPAIDPQWIELLTRSAASSTGLIVMDEKSVPVRGSTYLQNRAWPPGHGTS
jgi:hypothetical protein